MNMTRIWNKHKQTPFDYAQGKNTPLKKKVFVGMSGGVDSSVAAYLLKKQGYQVIGVFLRCYNIDGCAEREAEDARRVAGHLGISFYVWDFEKEYKKRVVEYMIDGYRHGLTPNPDVECNREVKFGLFLKKALRMGADYVATGHYVRLRRTSDKEFCDPRQGAKKSATRSSSHVACRSMHVANMSHVAVPMSLFTARDANKDQTYFLWTLTQEQLAHCLFPIGDYRKPDVRDIARRAGLPTAEKKDSQGVCFLGKVDVGDFLKKYIKPRKGFVVTTNGEVIGTHDGAYFYTIGQRHGLNLSDKQSATRNKGNVGAHYVAAKDIKRNLIIVAEGAGNPVLFQKKIILRNVNLIHPLMRPEHSDIPRNVRMSVMARVRYRQPLSPATLLFQCSPSFASPSPKATEGHGEASEGRQEYWNKRGASAKLVFDAPQKFVSEGQSAVFYSGKGEMLGGGIIC